MGHAEGQAIYEILLSFWLEFPFKLLSHIIHILLLMHLQCSAEVIKQVIIKTRKGEDRTGFGYLSWDHSPFMDLGDTMNTLRIY